MIFNPLEINSINHQASNYTHALGNISTLRVVR